MSDAGTGMYRTVPGFCWSSSSSLKNKLARMLDRILLKDDLFVKDPSSSLRNASFTTVVTVEESGDGDMKVFERWWLAVRDTPDP